MDNSQYLIPVIHFDDMVISSGNGSDIFDEDGNQYLDLNSGQFCAVLGHCNDTIVNKVSAQMKKISHTSSSMLSSEVIKFSQTMHRISGELQAYSILLSTGAEAVEFCIRYAKSIKKKDGIICFDKGYHGLTLGAQSVTFGGKFASPTINNIFSVPIPTLSETEEVLNEHIENFRQLVQNNYTKIAAAVFEPLVSVGGMLIPSTRFFVEIRKICDEYGILLIFDECQTGFGRTGEWFMYQSLGVLPDMVALAKGIGLGYPVAAVMFSKKLIMENEISITHYSSHQNDSFSASIVNIGIEYIEENNIIPQIQHKGEYFLRKLTQLSEQCEFVRNPRGRGLMLGLELQFNGVLNYRKIYAAIYKRMMKNHVIIQGTNGGQTLRFLPDYLITKENIDFAIDTLHRVLMKEDWKQYEYSHV